MMISERQVSNMIWNERLKELRLSNGMTLKEVAAKIGVTEGTAQRYESDGIKVIPYDKIIALADLYDCDPSYIMGWQKRMKAYHEWLSDAYDQADPGIQQSVNILLHKKEGE